MKKEYPYIGEFTFDLDLIVYFTEQRTGIVLSSDNRNVFKVGNFMNGWVEGNFKDITKEYIINKKMRVQNEEHANQINEMAARYGFEPICETSITLVKYMYFHEDLVAYSGKENYQYFKAQVYPEIYLPFINYDNKTPSEHEEVMNDPEDGITKLKNKIAELEKELSEHKHNTEQLAKLTDYLSTHKTLSTRWGDSTVETAIDLLSEYASSLEREQNDEDTLSQIQKVINTVEELVSNSEGDVQAMLETSLEWLDSAYEILYEQENKVEEGDIVTSKTNPSAGEYEVIYMTDKEVCVKHIKRGDLFVSDRNNFVRKGSASE